MYQYPSAALKSAIVITIALISINLPVKAQESPSETILSVNGQDFSLNLLSYVFSQLPDNVRQNPPESNYEIVIDDIIDTKLSADAARKSELADDPLLKEILQRNTDRLLAETWINAEIENRITEEMIKESYDELVIDTDSRVEVQARHILLESKEAAMEIISALDAGADFAKLAEESSTGPSAANGGDLGYFTRGAMVPSFEEASFNLGKGEYTKEPVQTQFGWHVIKIEDRRVPPAPTFEQAYPQLQNVIAVRIADEILNDLRDKADIKRKSFSEVTGSQEQQ